MELDEIRQSIHNVDGHMPNVGKAIDDLKACMLDVVSKLEAYEEGLVSSEKIEPDTN